MSFFPQLVAGPIERSTNLLKQFYEKHEFDPEKAITGINLMLWGFFLKIVVADTLAIPVNEIYNNNGLHSGLEILAASVLFCFQLYGDFAGYSYIAIGCSRVMGFRLMDYVYYPMVGASTNIYWWCFCIFSTFVISGFWHGASWTYVMSFAIFGLYLVVSYFQTAVKDFYDGYHPKKEKVDSLFMTDF